MDLSLRLRRVTCWEDDCAIIQAVIRDVGAPADANQVTTVEIYWSDGGWLVHHDPLPARDNRLSGGVPVQRRCRLWRRAYAVGRHDRRSRVYQYIWKTPLRGLVGPAGNGPVWSDTGWNFNRSNAMRMEPVL